MTPGVELLATDLMAVENIRNISKQPAEKRIAKMNSMHNRANYRTITGYTILRIFLGGAALSLLTCNLIAYAPHAHAQTVAMAPCSLHEVAHGSRKVTVALDSNGGSGYAWFIDIESNSNVRLLDKGTQVLSADPQRVGGAVQSWWKLEIGDSRQADVEFYLYRPWEGKDRAVQHCIARIVVK